MTFYQNVQMIFEQEQIGSLLLVLLQVLLLNALHSIMGLYTLFIGSPIFGAESDFSLC